MTPDEKQDDAVNNKSQASTEPKFLNKTKMSITTALRNFSCSTRCFVQSVFALIIVTSFVLIVLMSINFPLRPVPSDKNDDGAVPSRCEVRKCMILCTDAPDLGAYEDDVVLAVLEAEDKCGDHISLTLQDPRFVNFSMPMNWLSNIQEDIYELKIIGGNLKYIVPGAFLSNFARNIKNLIFQKLTIPIWSSDMLIGLANLEMLSFLDCRILKIKENAISRVSNTLSMISITRSGFWNPANVTGSNRHEDHKNLRVVDFSNNDFGRILGENSFSMLHSCESLNLNSNRITTIGAGAFDYMLNIKVIYLHNNHLVTIADGLFQMINTLSPMPRIGLAGNKWHCDCESNELIMVIIEGMLLGNPTCHTPAQFKDMVFSDFLQYCNVSTRFEIIFKDSSIDHAFRTHEEYVYTTTCQMGEKQVNDNITVISPITYYKCNSDRLPQSEIEFITKAHNNNTINSNEWIQPSFYLKDSFVTMFEIGSKRSDEYGLLWYKTICPNEVYCIQILPDRLRVYNTKETASQYTFCPISLATASIESNDCVVYLLPNDSQTTQYIEMRPIKYVCAAIGFLMFGAIVIYLIILQNPSLLKGSKRVLFVKHKNIEALVLPTKVILKDALTNDNVTSMPHRECLHTDNIFIMPSNHRKLVSGDVMARHSMRSNKSYAPSYISALQPTDEQLVEWRLRYHFDNTSTNSTITSLNSDLSLYTTIFNKDDHQRYSLETISDETTYESLK